MGKHFPPISPHPGKAGLPKAFRLGAPANLPGVRRYCRVIHMPNNIWGGGQEGGRKPRWGGNAHMERRVSRAGIRPGLISHIEGAISRAGIGPGNYATRRLRPGINATRLRLVALPTIMPSNYIFFNYYAFNLHF